LGRFETIGLRTFVDAPKSVCSPFGLDCEFWKLRFGGFGFWVLFSVLIAFGGLRCHGVVKSALTGTPLT
jgi:hypothetical protein